MKKNSFFIFVCLLLLFFGIPLDMLGQTYFKTVQNGDLYYNQRIARFSNGDILIGDSYLEPLRTGRESGKIVLTRIDNCGRPVWANSYSLDADYLELRDLVISPSDEILAYGSYFKSLGTDFFLLKVNGQTGKRALFRLYDPETSGGYFSYSLKKVREQWMTFGLVANPNTGFIALFDEAFQPLWAKKILPFDANGAAIISRDNSIIARSGNYLLKMNLEGDLDWSALSTVSTVNGPIETKTGFLFVGHVEGWSFFFQIDGEGKLQWQSDIFPAVEGSGAISLLENGQILFTYNCPSPTDNKLCQIIVSADGTILEQRQLLIAQDINSGVLTQSIHESNLITIAGNANAFETESIANEDFLLQFSLEETEGDCLMWETIQNTKPNSFDLNFESSALDIADFDLKLVERTEAVLGTFLYSLTELCGNSMEPILMVKDTLLPCGEDWLVSLPDDSFFWLDGTVDNSRLIEMPGIYKAKKEGCSDPITLEFRLEQPECDCAVYLPNIFSPNEDGVNDELKFSSNCQLDAVEMSVFNRYGDRLFYADTFNDFWDGRYQQNDVESGVYIITIQYQWTDLDGKVQQSLIYQDVTLIR